jgi:hypothetical protein
VGRKISAVGDRGISKLLAGRAGIFQEKKVGYDKFSEQGRYFSFFMVWHFLPGMKK